MQAPNSAVAVAVYKVNSQVNNIKKTDFQASSSDTLKENVA